ncbi:MAG: hypothetical protein AAF824_22545 [Bacteroidota bacterium]
MSRSIFHFISLLAVSTCVGFGMYSCNLPDDDDPVGETETVDEVATVTTLALSFQPLGDSLGGVILSYRDIDLAEGPISPTYSGTPLDTSVTYFMNVSLLDEQEEFNLDSKKYNVLLNVLGRSDEHQFFFDTQKDTVIDFSLVYNDEDNNGFPVGQVNTVTTGNVSGIDTLMVTLLLNPNKEADSVAIGFIQNAIQEETDTVIQVALEVQVAPRQ